MQLSRTLQQLWKLKNIKAQPFIIFMTTMVLFTLSEQQKRVRQGRLLAQEFCPVAGKLHVITLK